MSARRSQRMRKRRNLGASRRSAQPPIDRCPVRCRAGFRGGGDRGHDASGTDLVAVDVVVVAAVGEARPACGGDGPTRPRTGGIASSRGSRWVTSLRLPRVRSTAKECRDHR